MKHTHQINNAFYQALGCLFYAIAAADKNVRDEEEDKLSETLALKWYTSYGKEAGQIKNVFDRLNKSRVTSAESMNFFEHYFSEHKDKFSNEIKTLIWSTVLAIASSHAQKNKSELLLLNKLRTLFIQEPG